jgi:hypothetical protein
MSTADKAARLWMENGTLIVTPRASDVLGAAEALNAEISEMYPLVEVRVRDEGSRSVRP